ncbi:MAG: exo-beta-N-acetylmuramidase NamZ domain-containing protein [Rhodothermales bacterium]
MNSLVSAYCKGWAASVCPSFFTLFSGALFIVLMAGGCQQQPAPVLIEPVPVFRTGAEVLYENDFASFQGMTVGLVVNHTARVDTVHLGDLVEQAEGVVLGAFFGPEHGIRGDADAGEEIADGVDRKTGVPVYSLYGKQKKPAQSALEELDALVFDIQDIGARFYTYISTMGYAMQAAAEAGIPFYVLDRPNPLGGEYVSGFVREAGFESFVGLYPIPIAHGLTAGELARMIKGEAYLEGLENLDLRIIEIEGWQRALRWPALNRDWRPPSPNIPDFETALIYVGSCLFEAVSASEGRGTYAPFKQLGASWINSQTLVDTLNTFGLEGVAFSTKAFTPESIIGMSSNPRFKDQPLQGVMIEVTDMTAFDPLSTGIHLVHAFYEQAPASEKDSFFNSRWMGLLSGGDRLVTQFEAGKSPADIIDSWQEDVSGFKQSRAQYLLYD